MDGFWQFRFSLSVVVIQLLFKKMYFEKGLAVSEEVK